QRLAAHCDRIAVVGQSLGGLLTLRLAQQLGSKLAAVATLAAPLWLPPLARTAIRLTRDGTPLRRVLSKLPKLGGPDIRDQEYKTRIPGYRVIPIGALHQLVGLMNTVRGELALVRAPLLVIHGENDHTVPYDCSLELAARAGAETVQHVALERSYHQVALDVERDRVAELVGGFFDIHLKIPADS
ncbi:MAG: alpha/beta fold hydrolase, partial [Myxococcota bacterium]